MNKTEYLLSVLTEEGGEVIQAATKAVRFGLDSHHPQRDTTNETDLLVEFNQMVAVMEMLYKEGIVRRLSPAKESEIRRKKKAMVSSFMQEATNPASKPLSLDELLKMHGKPVRYRCNGETARYGLLSVDSDKNVQVISCEADGTNVITPYIRGEFNTALNAQIFPYC